MPLATRLQTIVGSPRAQGIAAVAFAASTLGYLLGDAWIGRTVFAYRDMHRVYLPARRYLVDRLLSGQWPEWYPYDGLGGSFVGEVVTGAFHPTALMHLVLPRVLAFNLSVGLAHAFAMLGMALLLRAWGAGRGAQLAGALAWSLCGYLVSMDGNLPYLLAGAAIPWVLWGVDGRAEGPAAGRWSIASLALASQVLASDPQAAFSTGLLAAILALAMPGGAPRRRAFAGLAVVGGLGALVGAAQALPALSALRELAHDPETLLKAQRLPLSPPRLFDLVVPQPFVTPGVPPPTELFHLHGFSSLWADSLFVGAPVLGLAAAALWHSRRRREVWLLLGVAAVGLLLALGPLTPVYGAFQLLLPPWRGFRYPEKVMLVVSFALTALAGLGAQAVLETPRARRALVAGLAGCLAASLAVVGLGLGAPSGAAGTALLKLAGAGEVARAELAALMPTVAGKGFLGALLAAGALVLSLGLSPRAGRLAPVALAAMVGLTLLAGNRELSRGYRVPPSVVFAEPKTAAEIKRLDDGGRWRFYAYGEEMPTRPVRGRDGVAAARTRFEVVNLAPSKGLEFGLEGLVAYLPLSNDSRARRAEALLPDKVYLSAFSGRYYFELIPDAADLEDHFRVQVLPTAGARVRLVQALPVAGDAELSARVSAPGFDPVAQAVVEGEGFSTEAPREAGVRVLRFEPERLEVEAWSQTPCALFVADRFAEGWTATIDGAPVALSPADVVGRALPFPAGRHRVELTYRAPGLRAGLLLSLLGLLIAGALPLAARPGRGR